MDEPRDLARLTRPRWSVSITVTDPVILGGKGYSWNPAVPGGCDGYAVALWNTNVPWYRTHTSLGLPAASIWLRWVNPFSTVFGDNLWRVNP